jgi:nucleoside-diphosphate-sugar epimerase
MKGAEVIFHLAARVGSLEYLHGSELAELVALQTNLVIDANVFRACIINKVKKLVYASSVAVYPMDKQYSPNAVFSENDLELKCLFACTQGTQPTIMTSDLGHRTSDIGPRTLDFGLRTLTVNIGSGEAVSIGTIAQKVVELSGKNIEIKYDPGKPVGPVSRTADITRARALLDWQPEVSLDEGLRRTYAWAAKRLEQR